MRCPYAAWARRARRKSIIDPSFKRVLGVQPTSQRQIAICRLLVACIALLMASSDVWAQATTSIRGTVSDPTGAVVPGANIMLENMGTAAVRNTITDNIGGYQFPQVPPGTYRIRAEKSGFKSVARANLELLVNTPMTLNLKFEEVGLVIEVNVFATPSPA